MQTFFNRLVLPLAFLAAACSTQAQVLPANRAVDWTEAGFNGNLPNYNLNYNMQFAGLVGDGQTPNDAAFNSVLTNLSGSSAIISFPAGNFLFNQPIDLPDNIIIRGAGADSTILSFDLGGNNRDAIQISGSYGGDTSTLFSAAKGSHTLNVRDGGSLGTGDYVRIIQNDSNLVTSTWAYGTVGQIIQLGARIGNQQIFTFSPLRLNYNNNIRRAIIQQIQPAQYIGIECLKIKRLDSTSGQTSNIAFNLAANCWVKGVESELTNFAHVAISASTNIEVVGSYFHDAHAYGGGGQGYGVALQNTSNECLITDNHFQHLRHSVLLQSGANGNVIAYNYSRDPFWSSFPSNSAGDLVLHGNYPYANLFEGNICANIVVDNSHGANGPHNTFFRNRAYLYGIVFSASNSPEQNLIGNEVSNPNFPYGLYTVQGANHFEYGNNLKGNTQPAGTDSLPELSYANVLVRNYQYSNSFGKIGLPNLIESATIAAKERSDYNQIIANQCGDLSKAVFSLRNSSLSVTEGMDSVEIWVDVRNMNPQTNNLRLIVQSGSSSATDGDDYQSIPNGEIPLQFNPMDNFSRRAVLYINDDALVEGGERLQLLLRADSEPSLVQDSVLNIDIFDNDVSNSEQIPAENWLIYPNPTENSLHIQADFLIQKAFIINSLGQLVYQNADFNQSNGQISTQHLPAGAYRLQIVSDKGIFSRNFIKK